MEMAWYLCALVESLKIVASIDFAVVSRLKNKSYGFEELDRNLRKSPGRPMLGFYLIGATPCAI
jgi:hypothetical protein